MINELIKIGKKNNIIIEVYNTNNKNWLVETFNNKIINYNISCESDYSIKALYKGKNIYLTTNNIENTDEIISKILYLYELSDNKDLSDFAKKIDITKKGKKIINIDFEKVSLFLKGLNKLKNEYPYLKTISTGFSFINKEIVLANKDIELKDCENYIEISTEVVIKNKGRTETNYFNLYTNKYDEAEIKNKVTNLIEETIKKLNAKSIKTSNSNVILSNKVMYEILKSFSSMFYAKNIRLGVSVLNDKFNKKVFNNRLSIIEDPNNENMTSSRLFDNEGTKTYFKEIIKNGIFKTKLYDNEEAKLDNTISTGNSYGVRNMYIIPGDKTLDELIEIANYGVIINDIAGLHSGINIITGDFSVQCSGYRIENGKKTTPIKMFVMSSNIIEILSNIKEVGNDLEFYEIEGGSPSVLVGNVDIAGSEK